ncbi:hypothetical protein PsYK624_055820 [Phanerochaete sordida]|uniref:Uncharacterized protein n=1 Tax=Phanerochaete sordida TaxID=48140 RepID=A0A9P3G718_9APHY|nr:hypothetical protein PsYK624_055820 [Phanerochaete sordida]
MPKDTSRDPSDEWYACARCGESTNLSLREHHRQVHQAECTLLFLGEQERVLVLRDADALWRCPRCAMAFAGSSRRIQEHARKGLCEGERPEDAVMAEEEAEDDWEAEEDGFEQSGVQDEEEQDDAFDMAADTPDEIADLAVKTGLQGEELARMVEWTTRKSERATRKTTVSEAIVALDTLMYPAASEPPEGFDPNKPSHPAVELNLDWFAPLSSSEPTNRPTPSSEAGSKSNKITRPPQHLGTPTASIQKMHAQVWEQGFAKLTPNQHLMQLNELQLPVQANIPPAGNPAASKRPAPFKSPLVMPGHERREVPEASPVSAVASPTRVLKTSSTPEFSIPPAQAPFEDGPATEASSSKPEVPPDLQTFFATARIPLDHLAPVFIDRGYVSAADLDTICEEPEFWEEMKEDIVAKGKLVSWLAARKCLTERAKMLGAAV